MQRRWLFVSPAQFGHLLVQLAVVEELHRRGDEVFVYAPARVKKHVEAAGGILVESSLGPFHDIEDSMHQARERSTWKPPAVRSPKVRVFFEKRERELRFRRTVPVLAEHTARAVRELAKEHRVAAIVTDALGFGARFGAELAGLPFATIAMDPQFSCDERGLPLHLPDPRVARIPVPVWNRLVDLALPLGGVRKRLGLPARPADATADFYGQIVSPSLHIVPAPQWFTGAKPGAKHVYVGPMAFAPPSGAPVPFDADRKTVLVTGSTTGHPRGRAMLMKTVRAFAGTDLDVVLAVGPVKEMFGALPSNIRVVEGFVRHEEVIPRVGALVSHGGWGTVGRAIRVGTPVLVIPAFGPQFAIGQRIEATGLGRTLAIDDVTTAAVNSITRELLESERIRERTRRASEEISATSAPGLAADALAELVA